MTSVMTVKIVVEKESYLHRFHLSARLVKRRGHEQDGRFGLLVAMNSRDCRSCISRIRETTPGEMVAFQTGAKFLFPVQSLLTVDPFDGETGEIAIVSLPPGPVRRTSCR
jgi:hypothetical protein